jgi:iron complex outermembrane receptor protein
MKLKGISTYITTTAIISTFYVSEAVWAQDVAPKVPQVEDQVHDIVVTARRESESLQRTPVAVTALGEATLAAVQISTISDLQRAAPSLSTLAGGPGGTATVYLAIRGQVNVEAGSTTDAAVATYVDGVNYARPTSGNFGFLDVAQVEVLRGPQGTLFGRNTTGGALNITTVQPSGNLGGYIRAGVGNYGAKKIEGAVTLPIDGDQLAMRVAGRFENRTKGYFDNRSTGGDLVDLKYAYAARATLRWAPDALPLTLSIAADISQFKDNGIAVSVVGLNPGFVLDPTGPTTLGDMFAAFGYNPSDYVYRQGVNFDQTYGDANSGSPFVDRSRDTGKQAGVSATLEVDIGGASKLRSISAWRQNDSSNAQDMDGMPIQLIAFGSEYHQTQFSQELQLSTRVGSLDLVGGLYYFQEQGTERVDLQVLGIFGLPIGRDLGDFKARSKAAFTQANYQITDRLRVTGGFRYTWDTRILDRHNLAVVGPPAICGVASVSPTTCSEPHRANFGYSAWTLGADYRFADTLFGYVKASSASKAGGFNQRGTPPRISFDPERLTDFEMGLKLDLFDRHLRTNLAIFQSDGERVQRIANAIIAGRTVQYTANTGDTRIKGAEFEVTALPWHGMTFNFAGSYLDGKYKRGTFLEDRGPAGIVDRSGEVLPQMPKWTFNVGATQSFDLQPGTLSLHADYSFTDEKLISADTPSPGSTPTEVALIEASNRLNTLKSFGTLNLRASFQTRSGMELALWARNVTNEEAFSYAYPGYLLLGVVPQYQMPPRTYGVDLSFTF